jgi:hypothetical protein
MRRAYVMSSGEIESMDWLVKDGLPLLARICLVVLFPFSGLDKIVNRDNATAVQALNEHLRFKIQRTNVSRTRILVYALQRLAVFFL